MDVREKLIEIVCDAMESDGCIGHCNNSPCFEVERVVNALIDNGVTVQELVGCKYCEEYEDLPEHFISCKPVGRVFDTCIQMDECGRWHLEVPSGADIGIKFCPMCGRKLPQPPKGE